MRALLASLLGGGGVAGNVGIRLWGAKAADPEVVAHIANVMGALALAQTT